LKTTILSPPHIEIYNSVLSGDKIHAYASLPKASWCTICLVDRLITYKELFSLVTTYKRLALSSISIPAGDIFSGHFLPNTMLSCNFNLLLMMAYFKIQLSFPPDAYKNFSSALNFNPYQDFGITTLSNTFSVLLSINWRVCMLCPLLVTAINFLEEETAIFNGKSPKGKERPAGDSCHPLESLILLWFNFPSSIPLFWASAPKEKIKIEATKQINFINNNFNKM